MTGGPLWKSDEQVAASLWLQCTTPRTSARLCLVCFPHAGASASFFRDWGQNLADTEVHAVRYPGRAERIEEEPPTDLLEMASQIAHALQPLSDRPLALFGHSMGAAVALETARSLEALGVTPVHLFASGSRNASCPVDGGDDHTESDTDLIEKLIRLGGTDREVAEDPFFQELVLPYVRADGRMFRTYNMEAEPLLHCPVTTIVGDVDNDSDLRPWSDLTVAEFREYVVSGDHFYLVAEPPHELLRARLDIRG